MKLFLCIIQHHAVNMYGAMWLQLLASLTSTLDGGDWLGLYPACFYTQRKSLISQNGSVEYRIGCSWVYNCCIVFLVVQHWTNLFYVFVAYVDFAFVKFIDHAWPHSCNPSKYLIINLQTVCYTQVIGILTIYVHTKFHIPRYRE